MSAAVSAARTATGARRPSMSTRVIPRSRPAVGSTSLGPEVDHEHRPLPVVHRVADEGLGEDDAGGAGRRDRDVGLGERAGQLPRGRRALPTSVRQGAVRVERSVQHADRRYATPPQVPGPGEREDICPARSRPRADPRGARHLGAEVGPGRHEHVGAAPTPVSRRTRAPGADRRVEHGREGRARGARPRRSLSAPAPATGSACPQHHRIQPARDGEQVLGGVALVVRVGVRPGRRARPRATRTARASAPWNPA